ncbi:glycosyltransferase family 2 protein [Bradyrhizobium sp. CW10]|uniref:glycosyltransferase family 2 protein n=1 Tax=Bradyrhizobium sp. CW10 TaxID=2782683 RepID=UPI001FF9236F
MQTNTVSSKDLAVIILARNEKLHIGRAIQSVRNVSSEIYVIDSFSTDGTVEIARQAGAVVVQHEFVNYAKQFQWALDNLPIKSSWIMRLDADEVIEPDLANEIRAKLLNLPSGVTGINLKRKHIFLGRWIKFGGRYPLILLRIWRWGEGRIEDRWMDEHIIIKKGDTVTLNGGFSDHNLNDLTFFTDKHNKYATREAIDVLNQRLCFLGGDNRMLAGNSPRQAVRKRAIKERIYNKIPFQLSALLYFGYRYVCQFGFLDGKEGLIYHLLQGFWYRFLVGAKIFELEAQIKHLHRPEEIRAELSRLTGLKL